MGAISKYGQNLVGQYGIYVYNHSSGNDHLIIYKIVSLRQMETHSTKYLAVNCNIAYSSQGEIGSRCFLEDSTVDDLIIIIDDCGNLPKFFKLFF